MFVCMGVKICIHYPFNACEFFDKFWLAYHKPMHSLFQVHIYNLYYVFLLEQNFILLPEFADSRDRDNREVVQAGTF